jgi:hypothetical protein
MDAPAKMEDGGSSSLIASIGCLSSFENVKKRKRSDSRVVATKRNDYTMVSLSEGSLEHSHTRSRGGSPELQTGDQMSQQNNQTAGHNSVNPKGSIDRKIDDLSIYAELYLSVNFDF